MKQRRTSATEKSPHGDRTAAGGPYAGPTMWGGRFKAAPDPRLRALNDSLAFDWELVEQDLRGSIAWAGALESAGVLSANEAKRMTGGLRGILREVTESRAESSASVRKAESFAYAEDVHSWVESRLREKVGPLAGKLHTGRSRNDQVATDLRLWLLEALREAAGLTLDLADALAARGAVEAATVMPGYTHLKRAEPVTFGHWCLAYSAMLVRDASRFADAMIRADECPLGSGALAGTPLEIDREELARELGFSRASANSLDAVSDRDAPAEYLFAASLLFTHLSRFAEDLIFYSADEVAFVELPDSLATGSSRMPQKKNPDLLELARGHAGRSIGELTGFLALLKGLPLAYNKDLQLDKEPLFRTRVSIARMLPVLSTLVETLTVNAETMRSSAASDELLATGLADALAARGIPFREAHEIVGRRVAEAEETVAEASASGSRLPRREMLVSGKTPLRGKQSTEAEASATVTAADVRNATPEKMVAAKNALGGTAPRLVKKAAIAAKKEIAKLRHSLAPRPSPLAPSPGGSRR
jgi:argininosuccinate lyase